MVCPLWRSSAVRLSGSSGRFIAGQLLTGSGRNRNRRFGVRNGNKMVYRGGCVAEYVERSPSTCDDQIGVTVTSSSEEGALPIRLSHTTTKSGGPARTTRYFRQYLDGAYALLTSCDTALFVAI